jgi:hypothetical protein
MSRGQKWHLVDTHDKTYTPTRSAVTVRRTPTAAVWAGLDGPFSLPFLCFCFVFFFFLFFISFSFCLFFYTIFYDFEFCSDSKNVWILNFVQIYKFVPFFKFIFKSVL